MGPRTRRSCVAALVTAAAVVVASPAGAGSARLDRSFGSDGIVKVNLPGQDQSARVAAAPDNKTVVAGYVDNKLAVVRLARDGSRDPTLDRDGLRVIKLGNMPYPNGLSVAKDGSIVVVTVLSRPPYGVDIPFPPTTGQADDGGAIALLKLNPNGSTDRTFGERGVALTQTDAVSPLSDYSIGVDIARDGSIVVLGVRGPFYGVPFLARFTSKGVRDMNFGIAGVAPTLPPSPALSPKGVVVLSDGRIVVGGETAGGVSGWTFLGYLPTGMPDLDFGDNGVAFAGGDRSAPIPNKLDGMLRGPHNSILGYGTFSQPQSASGSLVPFPAIAKLTAHGRLDGSYGKKGIVVFNPAPEFGSYQHAVVDPTGAVVTGLFVLGPQGFATRLFRITPKGIVDKAFGRPKAPFTDITGISLGGGRILITGNDPFGEAVPDGIKVAAYVR